MTAVSCDRWPWRPVQDAAVIALEPWEGQGGPSSDPQHSTICQAELVDRRLGAHFTIDVDTTGALVAAYSDTRQGGAVALPAFLRQTGGTSFLKGPPIGTGR